MRICVRLAVLSAIATCAFVIQINGEQQRILRRVIKSTPTATNLARVRMVHVRSSGPQQEGASELTRKEATTFGQRANETIMNSTALTSDQQSYQSAKIQTSNTTSAPPTTTARSITTPPAPSSTQTNPSSKSLAAFAGDRLQSSQSNEVEVLASASTSWQSMTAVEAPVAALIAAGTRPAISSTNTNDLTSSSSSESVSSASEDFLRSSNSKTNYASQETVGQTFSRLRQQDSGKTTLQQQQQSFFYPQQQRISKTSNYQQPKINWYQPTTARPAPIIQEQQFEHNEQYTEQQAEGSALPGQAEPFAFDFKTSDDSGNGQYRKEESDKNGVVRGSYGYTDANGIYRHVDYVADHNGFRANIKSNEPGLIGETQPASIRLAGGAAPSSNQRSSSSSDFSNESGDWTSAPSSAPSNKEKADLAIAPPDFESSHKQSRSPRHFRN